MKVKFLLLALLTLVVGSASLFTAGPANAHGGDENRFEVRREVRFDEDEFRREVRIKQEFGDFKFEKRVEVRFDQNFDFFDPNHVMFTFR